jgi:hypothetical protein
MPYLVIILDVDANPPRNDPLEVAESVLDITREPDQNHPYGGILRTAEWIDNAAKIVVKLANALNDQ